MTKITSMTMPDNVTYIEAEAFSGCSGIQSISLPIAGEKAKQAWGEFYSLFETTSGAMPSWLTVNISNGIYGRQQYYYYRQ